MPTGFQIGPLFVHYYGLIIMMGALIAAFLTDRLAQKRGMDEDVVWDMMPWLLIAGILGARLWHVFTPSASNVAMGLTTNYYLTHPLEILAIWKGGLGIPGAVMAGILALWIFCRKRNVSFMVLLDSAAPGLALAQAIGRWGNFINQELYGLPTDLPWAIAIDPIHRLPGYEQYTHFHPLFLYESLGNFFIAGFLLYIGIRLKNWLKDGDIFFMYLIGYPTLRFLLEYLRLDASTVGGVNANQLVMGVIVLGAIGTLVWRHRSGASVDEVAVDREAEVKARIDAVVEGYTDEDKSNDTE